MKSTNGGVNPLVNKNTSYSICHGRGADNHLILCSRGEKNIKERIGISTSKEKDRKYTVGLLYAYSESIVNRSPTACIQLFSAVDGFLWSFFVGWLLFISWSLVVFVVVFVLGLLLVVVMVVCFVVAFDYLLFSVACFHSYIL